MTTEIHTGNRKVTYGSGSLSITKTSTGRVLRAPLTAQDRRALANALDPIRATYDDGGPVPDITADQGGQWTRDDLPRIGAAEVAHDPVVDGVLDTVVHWLNKHYPKPERSAMDYAEIIAFEAARATRTERERDEALRKKGEMVDRAVRAERERDAAVERAEQAEAALGMANSALAREERRCEAALHKVDEWFKHSREWRDRAKKAEHRVRNSAPSASRADVEKALRESTNNVFADHAYPHMAEAMCALFGIEAEQAVDPIMGAIRDGLNVWGTTDEGVRQIAESVRRAISNDGGENAL